MTTKQQPTGALLDLRYRLRDAEREFMAFFETVQLLAEAEDMDSLQSDLIGPAQQVRKTIQACRRMAKEAGETLGGDDAG